MKNEYDYMNDISVDFSIYREIPLTKKEYEKMNYNKHAKRSFKKLVLTAACIGIVAALGITGYASGILGRLVKTASTGYNEFSQVDMSGVKYRLPKELNGLLFDKNGKKIKEFSANESYYDENGNEITDLAAFAKEKGIETLTTEDGKVKLRKESENPLDYAKKNGYPIIKKPEEINSYLAFSAKLPAWLPEGYTFLGASAYGDEYLFVYYQNENGQYIMLDERILNEETAFSVGTDGTLEEAWVNENKAVLIDGNNLNWETDGISVGISGRGFLSREEIFKIAESIK